MRPWPLTSLTIGCGDCIRQASLELSVWHSCVCEKLDGARARQALSGSAGATGTCLWLRRAHWQRPTSRQANCWMCWRNWAGKLLHLIRLLAGKAYLLMKYVASSTMGDSCLCIEGRHKACCESCSKEDTDAPQSRGAALPSSSEPVLHAHAPVMSMAGMPIHAGTGVKPTYAQRCLPYLLGNPPDLDSDVAPTPQHQHFHCDITMILFVSLCHDMRPLL